MPCHSARTWPPRRHHVTSRSRTGRDGCGVLFNAPPRGEAAGVTAAARAICGEVRLRAEKQNKLWRCPADATGDGIGPALFLSVPPLSSPSRTSRTVTFLRTGHRLFTPPRTAPSSLVVRGSSGPGGRPDQPARPPHRTGRLYGSLPG